VKDGATRSCHPSPELARHAPHPGGSGPRPAAFANTLIGFSVLCEWPIVLGRATTFVPAKRHSDGPRLPLAFACLFYVFLIKPPSA
jgi:hypothetical protein